jgi:hypothetical protein
VTRALSSLRFVALESAIKPVETSAPFKEFRSSGVQEFRSSGVQEFRSSGVQEFSVGEPTKLQEKAGEVGEIGALGNLLNRSS